MRALPRSASSLSAAGDHSALSLPRFGEHPDVGEQSAAAKESHAPVASTVPGGLSQRDPGVDSHQREGDPSPALTLRSVGTESPFPHAENPNKHFHEANHLKESQR